MAPKSITELFGLPPAPETGRDRLIAVGIELFYRQGIQATGIDQVLDRAGVTKTTFYKHFEGKDDFVLACLRSRDEWEMSAWDRAARTLVGDDPRAQLLAFFDVLDLWFNSDDFRGCMFINVAAEFADRRDPIHRAAAHHKIAARDHFRALAARAGAIDPDALADEYTILLEGTLILRHVHDRDDAARVGRRSVEALLDRELPVAATKR